jgi:uncharacterized protein (TIGR00369 family)
MPSKTEQPVNLSARWNDDEAKVRATILPPGVTPPATVTAQRGIDFLRAWLEGKLPPPPLGHTLDFLLVEAQVGRVVFQGRPSAAHFNPLATVHGGWMASLLDSALGCTVHSVLPAGKAYTTAELKVNFVRAVTPSVGILRAEGQIIHQGSRMATADARLLGPDGKLYGHGSTTCFVFDAVAVAVG